MKAVAVQPFSWNVRVYYEDTDAAGVVYYANYLKYLERARTEWLAASGISVSVLEREHTAIFVVHRVEIDYRCPARLGDSLTVSLETVERSRVRMVVAQDIEREHEIVANARVTLACLEPRTWRPIAIPDCVPGGERSIGRGARGRSASNMESPR